MGAKKQRVFLLFLCLAIFLPTFPVIAANQDKEPTMINPVLTTFTMGQALHWIEHKTVYLGDDSGRADVILEIDPTRRYQEFRGMGISLEETSISNLWKLDPETREATIKMIVDPEEGAGISLFRITIGSPDCIEHLPFWSYNELPEGVEEDFELKYFSIQRDIDAHIIDTIKLIQKYNPNAQFFASAWSAPAWMTTTNTFTGYVLPNSSGGGYIQASKLRDDCINVLARYYVKFIQAYGEHGIKISAITMLNEPGIAVVYPAMDISVSQQRKLALEIKKEFALAGLDTKLWVHDFNFYDWKDPNSSRTKNYYRIFEDSADGSIKGEEVINATDGIAFHSYWGTPDVAKEASLKYQKPVHMTETNKFDPDTIISYFHNYMGSYTGWTTITDQDGGTLYWTQARHNNVDWSQVKPSWKNRLVTTNHNTGKVTYTDNFYAWGQFGKYLKPATDTNPGAVRIYSPELKNNIASVAFQNPDGEIVLIVHNRNPLPRRIKVTCLGESFAQTIPGNSTATLRWYQ